MSSVKKEIETCITQTEFILKLICPRKNAKSSSSSLSLSDVLIPFSPPDEASGALGKQLGESYLKCITLTASLLDGKDSINSIPDDSGGRKKMKELENLGDDIIKLLSNPNVNLAVVDHFFSFIANVIRDDKKMLHSHAITMINKWWEAAIITCEHYCCSKESGGGRASETNNNINVVFYAIRGFVEITFAEVCRRVENLKEDDGKKIDIGDETETENMLLVRLLQNLKLSPSRSHLIRECIGVSFQCTGSVVIYQAISSSIRTYLMPLFAATVISAPLIHQSSPYHSSSSQNRSNNHLHYREEAKLFIDCLLQECNTFFLRTLTKQGCQTWQQQLQRQQTFWDILSWLISALELFYASSIMAQYDDCNDNNTVRRQRERQVDHINTVLEMGYDFIRQLLELALASLSYLRSSSLLSDQSDANACKFNSNNDRNHNNNVLGIVAKFFDVLLIKVLPVHVVDPDGYSSPSIRPIWTLLRDIVQIWKLTPDSGNDTCRMHVVSPAAIYRLAVLSLHSSHEKDIAIVTELISLLLLLPTSDKKSGNYDKSHYPYGSMVLGAARSVGCMFLTVVPNDATTLVDFTSKMLSGIRLKGNIEDSGKITRMSGENFFELFDDMVLASPLQQVKLLRAIAVPTVSSSIDAALPLSISMQNNAMLLGLSILCIIDTNNYEDDIDNCVLNELLAYLNTLLTSYPHLGRRCLSVLIASCNCFLTAQKQPQAKLTSQTMTNSSGFMKVLKFLCSSVARDAHCAHEIWSSIIVPMLNSNIGSDATMSVDGCNAKVDIQCMVLRLFPTICQSNRRLYGRIRDTIALYVNHKNIQLKIAAAATICDMAKEDLIKDVTDVIGWIQSFLVMSNTTTTDNNGECLVVYYAIMSLHYLVVGEELDYTNVVKVLNKKLVNITKVDEVLKLKDTMIEALVTLLGDGEEDKRDSESEDMEEGVATVSLSPQVKNSISTLIDLALSSEIEPINSVEENGSLENKEHPAMTYSSGSSRSRLTILSLICRSLANYSLQSLGIDESTVRSVSISYADTTAPTEDEGFIRYNDLKRVLKRAIDNMPCGIEEYTFNVTMLASKLIKFEGDILDQASLWKKQHRNIAISSNDPVEAVMDVCAPKKYLKLLPSYESVYQRYIKDPSIATASATLLCLRGAHDSINTTVEDVLALVSELANDMGNILPDPISNAITIRSWVSGMAEVWRVIDVTACEDETNEETVAQSIDTILGWRDELDQMDTAYVALAAFVLAIPDTMSRQIDIVNSTLTNAYTSCGFDDVGMACNCLGILAVKNIMCTSFTSLNNVIDIMEKELTISSKSGDLCFQAALNLSLIVQSLMSCSLASKRYDRSEQIQRIVAILILQLSRCFVAENQILLLIASSLKAGEASADLLQICCKAERNDFHVSSSKQTILSLYVALSLVMPAVLHVNNNVFLGLNILLRKMPWGYGKGYMLSSAYRVSKIAKLMTAKERSNLLDHCSKVIHDRREGAEYHDALLVFREISNDDDLDLSITSRCKEILENNDLNFSLAIRASMTIAFTKNVGSLPILFGGDGDFFTNSKLRVDVSKTLISQTVKMLTTIADNLEEDTRLRESAAMNIGILASMRFHTTQVTSLSQRKSVPLSSDENVGNSDMSMLPLIPFASDGTLTSIIRDTINNILRNNIFAGAEILSSLLMSLRGTSLPISFAKLLETLLRQEETNDNIQQLRHVCCDLIVEQATALRRAASDRREFVRVTELLARLPPASLFSQLGSGVTLFMQSLDKLVPLWISNAVMDATQSLWSACCYEITHRYSSKSMVAFLASLKQLLSRKLDTNRIKNHNLSADNSLAIQRHLVVSFFPELCSIIMPPHKTESIHVLDDDTYSLWNSFFSCLSHVSIEILDEYDFFSFQGSPGARYERDSIARVHAICYMRKKGILNNRGDNDLFRAQLWTAKQNLNLDKEQRNEYWLAALHLAQVSFDMSLESRKTLITALFEIMLVNDITSCLDLLSAHVAIWALACKHSPAKNTEYGFELLPQNVDFFSKIPSNLFLVLRSLLLKNCPQNLAIQMEYLHMSSFIMNRALQILTENAKESMMENSVQMNYIRCLKSMIIRSKNYGGDSVQHKQHTSFVSKNLCRKTYTDNMVNKDHSLEGYRWY